MTNEERIQRFKGQYLKTEPKKKTSVKGNNITVKSHLSFLSGSGRLGRHSGAQ